MEQETSFIDVSSFFASPDVLRFIHFLRMRLSWDQQAELALALGLCIECGGALRRLNGEVVCERCGLVWHEGDSEQRIPFPEFEDASENGHYEAHWNPGSSLAFGRGLGTTLSSREIKRILERGPKGEANFASRLRTLIVAVRANRHDPPGLERLLARISLLLDKNGLRGNHIVADHAGRVMRRIYSLAQLAGIHLHVSVADAVAAYTFHKYGIRKYDRKRLKLTPEDLALIKWYIRLEKDAEQMRRKYMQVLTSKFAKRKGGF